MLVNPENVRALRLAISEGTIRGDFLPSIYIVEPTSRCKLGCIMCPNSLLGQDKLGDADVPALTRTFEKIAPYAELVMLYFMGESTLHPDFIEILESARHRIKGKLVLSTSAFELSQDQIDSMVKNLDILIVCIDRWEPDVYEKIRVGSNFAQVVANTEAILRTRGPDSPLQVIVKALDIHLPDKIDPNDLSEWDAFAQYWSVRGALPLGGWLNSWAGQLPNLLHLSKGVTPYQPDTRVPCADLWFKMVVNWQSRVVLCCHNWDYSVNLGDMNSTLEDTWHGDALVSLRTAHLARDYVGASSICATCREWGEGGELDAYLRLSPDDLFTVF